MDDEADDFAIQQLRDSAKDDPDIAFALEMSGKKKFSSWARREGVSKPELVSAGSEAAREARKSFDPAKGNFKAYAYRKVRFAIIDCILSRHPEWQELPEGRRKLYCRLHTVMGKLKGQQQRAPTDEELALSANVHLDQIKTWRNWLRQWGRASLDGRTEGPEGSGETLGNLVEDLRPRPDDEVAEREFMSYERLTLEELVQQAKLQREEEEVLRLRWGLDAEMDLDQNEGKGPRPRPRAWVAEILATKRGRKKEYQIKSGTENRQADYNSERVRLFERQAVGKIAALLQRLPMSP